jgi:hypothetical protein
MDAPPALFDACPPETFVRWFAPQFCVIERGAMCEVFAGGLLLGQYEREVRDRGARNMLLVTLAQEPQMHLGQLAEAFEVSEGYLRILRRKAEADGLGAGLSGIALTARLAPAQDGVRTAADREAARSPGTPRGWAGVRREAEPEWVPRPRWR